MDAGSQSLPKGALIGKYEITQVLGIGGFGITYKAWDRRLECNVAIKEYLPVEYAFRDPNTTDIQPHSNTTAKEYSVGLQRFLEEARTLAKFKDPNIVRVVDHIEANGTAYLVMDYEEGETLSNRLKREGTLSESALLAIILPILNGLRTLHSVSILHRDIKPGNIYLRLNGSPVLIDFGSAKQHQVEQTRSVTTMVTAGYAPYEQYSNRRKQGPYTDLYALGATMHRCINGNDALPQSTDRIIATNDNGQDPLVSAVKIGAGRYNRSLLEAIDWMLQIKPKNRPQTVDEVLATIASLRVSPEGTDSSARTRISPVATPDADVDFNNERTIPVLEIATSDIPVSHRHQVSLQPRRHQKIHISLGVTAVAATAIGIGIWQQWIDVEYEDFAFGKSALTTGTPRTGVTEIVSHERIERKGTREPAIEPEQTEDVIAGLVKSTISAGDATIQALNQVKHPTMASAVNTLGSPPLPDEDSTSGAVTPTTALVSSAPVPEAASESDNSTKTALRAPEAQQPFNPETAGAAGAPSTTTGDYVVTVGVVDGQGAETMQQSLSEASAAATHQSNILVEPPFSATTHESTIVEETSLKSTPPPVPIEDPTSVAERKRLHEIAELLRKGQDLLTTGNLTRPENNNALATYLKIIELEPDNALATKALNAIGARLQAIAEQNLRDREFNEAKRYIELALTIQAGNANWLALSDQIESERQNHYSHQKRLAELLQHAKELESKGINPEDTGENSADIYFEVLAMDSANQAARTGLLDTLVFSRQLLQSNPSLAGYQRLTHYALLAVEKDPKDEAINNLYLDVQRESALWQEQQNAPKISRIVTANTEPTSNTPPRNHFGHSTAKIYVAFDYHNFSSGEVIRAVLFDGAQKIKLMQVPVVINSTQGTHTFYLNKPIDGFQTGSYRLEMIFGEEHIAAAEFVIDE